MEAVSYVLGVLLYVLYAFFGFCTGGILFSYHIPKIVKGIDICALSDDGNPGTVNAFKYAGVPVGFMCLLCDLLKAYVPVMLAFRALNPTRLWFAPVISAPVLGHAFAPLYHGKSGKAIAASFGALLALIPQSYIVFLLAALYVFFSLIFVVRPNELRTVVSFGLFTIGAFISALFTHKWSFTLGAVCLSAVVIHKNMRGAKLKNLNSEPEQAAEAEKRPQMR